MKTTRKRVKTLKTVVSEKLVADIWQCRMVTDMVTDAGEEVHIIYPGRKSSEGGCDFQDAIFTIGGKPAAGNVEVHVRSAQWYSHGHHRDPKYNSIALHVVMWHDCKSAILLQCGDIVPTICLSSFLTQPLNEVYRQTRVSRCLRFSCPEAASHSTKSSLLKLLDVAGQERFVAKIASFREVLIREEADQVLFRGIARALGYAKNTVPFEELADRLCPGILKENGLDVDVAKQAWIFGVAGLLPSQRLKLKHPPVADPEVDELERIWRASGVSEAMTESDWCFFRVRPDNFPTRRIAALSCLLARYRQSGLLQGLLQLVREGSKGPEHRRIENGLIVSGQGYWAGHFDFGADAARSSALLGRGKAGEIAINILLPFVYAWAEVTGEPRLKERTENTYLHYPKLEDNQLTLYMRQQLLHGSDVNLSACQQQGLLYIYNNYCRYRDCTECPVALNRC